MAENYRANARELAEKYYILSMLPVKSSIRLDLPPFRPNGRKGCNAATRFSKGRQLSWNGGNAKSSEGNTGF